MGFFVLKKTLVPMKEKGISPNSICRCIFKCNVCRLSQYQRKEVHMRAAQVSSLSKQGKVLMLLYCFENPTLCKIFYFTLYSFCKYTINEASGIKYDKEYFLLKYWMHFLFKNIAVWLLQPHIYSLVLVLISL